MPDLLFAEFWDDLFHAFVLEAFVAQAIAQRGSPDSEAIRVLAYRLYEEALSENDAQK
jgi:hypothetical protein